MPAVKRSSDCTSMKAVAVVPPMGGKAVLRGASCSSHQGQAFLTSKRGCLGNLR